MIAFCGPGRSGKDTAALMFSQMTKLRYSGSISWHNKAVIAAAMNLPEQTVWENRHDNRVLWLNILNDYKAKDEAKLVRNSLLNNDIVVGIRNILELQSAMSEGLIKMSVWVNKNGIEIDPTLTYTSFDCTHVLNNNGDLDNLKSQVEVLASVFSKLVK